MSSTTTLSDWGMVACAILLLVCYGALLAPRVFSAAVAGWRGLRVSGIGGPFSRKRGEDQALKQLIGEMMSDKRVNNFRYMMPIICFSVALTVAVGLARTVAGSERTFSFASDIAMFVTFAWLLFAERYWRSCPRAVTTGTYFMCCANCLFLVVAEDDPKDAHSIQSNFRYFRLALSVAYMKSSVVCCVAALHVFATSLAYARIDSQLVAGCSISFREYTQEEIIFCVFMVILTWTWERSSIAGVRQRIEFSSTQSEAAACRRLLNTICDATFELDADLGIVDDATQLAGALQHGFNRSLKGAKVERFVVESDRDLFRERIIASVPESQLMANVFHVGMRDSLSNRLNVEVFHVPVVGSLTNSRHLLGIREHADTQESGRCMQQRVVAHIAAERLNDSSERRRLALVHLLMRLCSCVIHLGPDLELTEPCEKLSSMLGLRDSCLLKGRNFRDLLATKEDARLFSESLLHRSTVLDPAGVLPIRLRDSQGSHLQVHAHFSCFRDQDDVPRFFVAIVGATGPQSGIAPAPQLLGCPSSDLGPAPSAGASEAVSDISRPSSDISRSSSDLEPAPLSGVAEQGSDDTSRSSSSLMSEPRMHQGADQVSVTFEADQQLRVISTTPGFSTLCGPDCATPCLADWLAHSDAFKNWTQHAVNSFLSTGYFQNLTLRTPRLMSAGLEVVAGSVWLDSISCTSSEEGESYVLRVTLSNTRQQPLHRHHPHQPVRSRSRRRTRSRSSSVEPSPGRADENVLEI